MSPSEPVRGRKAQSGGERLEGESRYVHRGKVEF